MVVVYVAVQLNDQGKIELETILNAHGATRVCELTRHRVHLVVSNGSSSKRVVKAKKWGIPVVSLDELAEALVALKRVACVAGAASVADVATTTTTTTTTTKTTTTTTETTETTTTKTTAPAPAPAQEPATARICARSLAVSSYYAHAVRVLATTPSLACTSKLVSGEDPPHYNEGLAYWLSAQKPKKALRPAAVRGSFLYRFMRALQDVVHLGWGGVHSLNDRWPEFFRRFQQYVLAVRAITAAPTLSRVAIATNWGPISDYLDFMGDEMVCGPGLGNLQVQPWENVANLLLELCASPRCKDLAGMCPHGDFSTYADAPAAGACTRGVRFAFGQKQAAEELHAAQRAHKDAPMDHTLHAGLHLGDAMPTAHLHGFLDNNRELGAANARPYSNERRDSVAHVLGDVICWVHRLHRRDDAHVVVAAASLANAPCDASLVNTDDDANPLDCFQVTAEGVVAWPLVHGAGSVREYARNGNPQSPNLLSYRHVMGTDALERSMIGHADVFKVAKVKMDNGSIARCVVVHNHDGFVALKAAVAQRVAARQRLRADGTKVVVFSGWHERLSTIEKFVAACPKLERHNRAFVGPFYEVALLQDEGGDDALESQREHVRAKIRGWQEAEFRECRGVHGASAAIALGRAPDERDAARCDAEVRETIRKKYAPLRTALGLEEGRCL